MSTDGDVGESVVTCWTQSTDDLAEHGLFVKSRSLSRVLRRESVGGRHIEIRGRSLARHLAR